MSVKIPVNEQYSNHAPRWKRVRDVVDGEYRLKQHDLDNLLSISSSINNSEPSTSYLRVINPQDKSDYNRARNRGYINGARLFNASQRTLSGLTGMVNRVPAKEPELNPSLSYLWDNVDGSGLSMRQQSAMSLWNIVQVGRDGLLTDMPRNDSGQEITQAQVNNGFRPSIKRYSAENILDWSSTVINGAKTLSYLALREYSTQYADETRTSRVNVEIIRIYRLDGNVVTVQEYEASKDGGYIDGDEVEVMAANGQPLGYIPFEFIGSVNNEPSVDIAPLEQLVDINLGHYQESANLRSSSYELSAANMYIADDNYQNQVSSNAEDSSDVETGEETVKILGTGGTVGFASPNPNNISSSLMENDEQRMIAAGAQIITPGGQAETAEAARIKRASDVSTLSTVVMNIGDAYSRSIETCYLFLGIPYDGVRFELNDNFFSEKLSAQEITALISLWQGGAISKSVFDSLLKKGAIIGSDVDLEIMNEAIENEQAAGGMPDMGA